MILRHKDDRAIGPTVPTKLSRRESSQDMSSMQEVALQQIAESDPNNKRPALSFGVLDIMCGCFYGSLNSVSHPLVYNFFYFQFRADGTTTSPLYSVFQGGIVIVSSYYFPTVCCVKST